MTLLRCTVCKLPPDKREAIDAALSSATITLTEVSSSSGISKSALQRHSKHLDTSAPAEPKAIQQTETLPPTKVLAPITPAPHPDATGTKARLLERIELLWNESLDGLALSKEPIVVTKPDGSSIELPGDLRARAGFIREARSILEMQGEATGDFVKGQPLNLIGQVMIVMPAALESGPHPPVEIEYIDIGE